MKEDKANWDFAIGLIIVSTAIGCLFGGVYGWLFFGVILMILGTIAEMKGNKNEDNL